MGRHSGPRYYAVANGRSRGVYTSWEDCSAQVTGYRGAVFKSFGTEEEADEYISKNRPAPAQRDTYENMEQCAPAQRARRTRSPPQATAYEPPRRVAPAAVPYSQPAPTRAVHRTPSDSHQHQQQQPSHRHTHSRAVQDVYVDGACSHNGRQGATGGYGGYYGDNDHRNFSLPLPAEEAHTNNRGEMRAVIHAMEQQLRQDEPLRPLRVHTDSRYVIDGLTRYSKKWVENGFRLSTGDPVKNQDLWKRILDTRDAYNTRYARQENQTKVFTPLNTLNDGSEAVELRHVRGHSNIHGNERADRLAVLGAKRPRE